jgi:hypothetical protein
MRILNLNRCPRIPLPSLGGLFANRSGGGQAGGLAFAFALVLALWGCSSVPWAST